MKRAGPEGAVSIFLACVLLTLIVFSCSIVDITRIHVARLQSERAFQQAGESILASYDSQLQSQYGIFAKDFSSKEIILKDLNRYTQSALNPTTITTTSNVFYESSDPMDSGFSLYENQLGPITLSDERSLLDPEEVKEQILAYMTYRAPFGAIEPFLEKMGLLSKATKTSEILSQKNEVVGEIQTLELGYYDLEMLIDGIMINGAMGCIKTDSKGQPALYPNYVKKIITKDSYVTPLYTAREIPLESYQKQLNNNVCNIDEVLKDYQESISQSGQIFTQIISTYKTVQEIQEQITSNAFRIAQVQQQLELMVRDNEEASQTTTDLENELSGLEQLGVDLSQQEATAQKSYQEGVTFFNHLDDMIYYHDLPLLQNLIEPYSCEEGTYGLKGIIEEALLEIVLIKAKTPEVAGKIKTFKETLVNSEELCVEGTAQNVLEEMEQYENLLGLNDKGGSRVTNDLAAMQITLLTNLDILNALKEDVMALVGTRLALQTNWYHQNKSILSQKDFESVLRDLKFFYDESLPIETTIDQEISRHLDAIETTLDGYSREMYFDYSGMDFTLETPFDYGDFVKAAQNLFPKVTLPQLDLEMDDENLPSKLMGTIVPEAYQAGDRVDLNASSKYLDTLKSLGASISKDLIKLKDDLYMNEYVIGMFKTATDNLMDEKGEPSEADTLSHFPKSTHYMNYEVEYVLFGHSSDVTNLFESIAILFGIRIAFNLISLLLDCNKMETIINISEAVAGWWSLGIGSIVMISVLTLIWSMTESVSDVMKLLKDEKVPIIKNADTWETDFFSGISHAAEEVTEEASTKSYLPCLRYEDYLRLFLLSGQVDDGTKCSRVLDLIQMNLAKERNEDIHLCDYVVGFEADTSVDVNTLFFKIPFMPSRTRNRTAFSFNLKTKVAY